MSSLPRRLTCPRCPVIEHLPPWLHVLQAGAAWGNAGCDGGLMRGAFEYAAGAGVPLCPNATYPYYGPTSTCRASPTSPACTSAHRGSPPVPSRSLRIPGPYSLSGLRRACQGVSTFEHSTFCAAPPFLGRSHCCVSRTYVALLKPQCGSPAATSPIALLIAARNWRLEHDDRRR